MARQRTDRMRDSMPRCGMKTQSASQIACVDIMDGSVLVEFEDGKSVLHSAYLLRSVLPHAAEFVATDDCEEAEDEPMSRLITSCPESEAEVPVANVPWQSVSEIPTGFQTAARCPECRLIITVSARNAVIRPENNAGVI